MNNPQIAQTIKQQIGSGSLYMLGAKDLLDLGNGLQFKIRGSRKANTITITLSADDTYQVKISKVTGGRWSNKKMEFSPLKEKVVGDHSGVYVDALRSIIEGDTGLYMSL